MKSIISLITTASLVMTVSLISVSCGESSDNGHVGSATSQGAVTAPAAKKRERGGTITVGDQTWKIIPSIQCGVYPGDVVAIAGHAESDKQVEIVIDNDPNGRSGASVGTERGAVSWHAVRETLKIEVNGKQVHGTATFSVHSGGAGETAPGKFEVNC